MKYPDNPIEVFKYIFYRGCEKEIQVVSFSGDLQLYYDAYPEELPAKLKDEENRSSGWNANLPNKEITCASACIFDTGTERYSDTSIYKNKKGYWFKKAGKKYYFHIDIKPYF